VSYTATMDQINVKSFNEIQPPGLLRNRLWSFS